MTITEAQKFSRLKKTFALESSFGMKDRNLESKAYIVFGQDIKGIKPFVRFSIVHQGAGLIENQVVGNCFLEGKELERFAINILKVMDSKHLKK